MNCAVCGEEILNEREVWRGAAAVCQSCAGLSYYNGDHHYLSKQREALYHYSDD